MLLLNEYHEDISKLHVNMMQRRSYYVPFVDTNEAITIKDRNKQNNFKYHKSSNLHIYRFRLFKIFY